MIGGACQGATPTSLPQPIGAALRPPWPSATIEDGALAGALPPVLASGQMMGTPTMLETMSRPPVSPTNINNNMIINNKGSSSSPKSNFGIVTTVAASKCVIVGSRDTLRMSSVANSSKLPLMSSQCVSKPNQKNMVPHITASSTVSGCGVAPEQASAHMFKSSLHCAKEEKDRLTGVQNTNKTLEQPLNCKVTQRTFVPQLVSCPVSSSVMGGGGGGGIGRVSPGPPSRVGCVVSLSSAVENSVNSVPINEKDSLKIQNHKLLSPRMPHSKHGIQMKALVPNLYKAHNPKKVMSMTETVTYNGTGHQAEINPSTPVPFTSVSLRCTESLAVVKPVYHSNDTACDLSFNSRSKDTANFLETQTIEPVNFVSKSDVNKNDYQVKKCSGDAKIYSGELCPTQENVQNMKTQTINNYRNDHRKEDSCNPISSFIGDQCSRTTPGLHESYVQERKVKLKQSISTSLSASLSPLPVLSPANTPISVGDSSLSCPPIVALTQLAVPRIAPPTSAATSAGVGNTTDDSSNRASRKPNCRTDERPTVTITGGGSIPVGIAVARQRQEPRPAEESFVPLTNGGTSASPGANTGPSHWPLPPTPCTPGIPSAPFWLSQSQFAGVGMDTSVGAGMGLGYQFVRDHLSGHYYVLPHPHTIPDPGGHSLVWAGYGGVAAPPPVVLPQQILALSDYHRALHPALVHVPHPHAPVHNPSPPIKREDPQTPVTPDEDPKSQTLNIPLAAAGVAPPGAELNLPNPLPAGLRHLPPPYLYPPASTLPYYLPQSPHGSPFGLPTYHPQTSSFGSSGLTSTLPNSLTTTLTDTLTQQGNITTYSVLPAAPVTSVAKGSGLEHCSSKECESLVATGSPAPQSDTSEPVNVTSHSEEEEPDVESHLPKAHSVVKPLSLPVPFKIKQEIKEEIPSPVGPPREDACHLGVADSVENHLPSSNSLIAIKKESLIGCEDNLAVRSIQSHDTSVVLSHNKQSCSQSTGGTCTTLISPNLSESNLPVNPTSSPSSVSSMDVCHESLMISEPPVSQILDFSSQKPSSCCESPLQQKEASMAVGSDRYCAVITDSCDTINSETHSSKNLECSSSLSTSNSKALFVTQSFHGCVSTESKPLTVVHPVQQATLHEKEADSDVEEEVPCAVGEDDDTAVSPDKESHRPQPVRDLDLSGLELLSQSVLQHAIRLSSLSPNQLSSENSQSPLIENPVPDCTTELEDQSPKDSSVTRNDDDFSDHHIPTPEELPKDTCCTDDTSSECCSPSNKSKNYLETNENSSESCLQNVQEMSCENSCSSVLKEGKEVQDRMPELVRACLNELPCSPTSRSPEQESTDDVPICASPEECDETPAAAATSMPDQISGLHGLSLLCALAAQRIMAEEHEACPALSSLADVAATSPSVPTHPLLPQRSPSPQPGPSYELKPVCPGPFGSVTNNAVFGSTTFGTIPSSFSSSYTTPIKSADVNRNYKSPESEREAKAFIANKASQYQKDAVDSFKSPSGFPVDSMDATELDMRMRLAEIQRKYRETQFVLSRLPPKKMTASPAKRGPGRPRKRKIINNDVPGKKKVGRPSKRKQPEKELSPPILEPVTDLEIKDITKDLDDNREETCDSSRLILKPPVLTATFTNQRVLEDSPISQKTPETHVYTEKEESSDDDTEKFNKSRRWSVSSEDAPPPSLGSPFKPPVTMPESHQEESEEEPSKEGNLGVINQDLKVLNTENSVESSPSDLEQQSSSASKKRKPGRPKKHSPTKEDATETIVAKKPKTLNFMLHRPILSNKPKMRPKLKAEVKIREEEEEENSPKPHYAISSNGDPSLHALSDDEEDHKQNVRLGSLDIGRCVRKRGCPRARGSLTRREMIRDKEKRKSAAEKQSHLEALYRSLKKLSTVAAAEHDESEDEKEKEEKDTETSLTTSGEGGIRLGGREVRVGLGIANESCGDQEANHRRLSEGDSVSSSGVCVSNLTTTVTMTVTTVSNITTTTSLSEAPRPSMQTPEPSVCVIETGDLVDKARVLVLQDGLLYAGHVVPIQAPDVYGVVIDGERGSRPHIYCREELLNQSWKEVKPGSSRFLVEGTRVCAFWSQQYRALYPGCVAASSSPAHEANHNFVNVEFDDGDSGKIHVDDIRLLPTDFPVIEYDPNPLMTLNKRKRRPTGDSHSSDIREECQRSKQKKVRTYSGTSVDSECKLNDQDDENLEVEKENQSSTVNIESKCREAQDKLQNKKSDKKKHKKHKHTESSHHHRHKHKNKHRHRHHEEDRPFPHIEPGVNELTMRIKSPPPPLSESQRQRKQSYLKESDTEDEISSKSPSDEESEGNDSEYMPNKKESVKGPGRKKKRHPSGKSKIAPFLPERQLWRWSGKGFKRPGAKGKGKKEFFKAIVRGKERICVEDCAVFLSAGQPDRPYIGKIEHMWESWGGNMVVKVKWFYHPQETKGLGRRLTEPKGALFQSPHTDENDVQTISHKCDVIALSDYKVRRGELESRYGPNYENFDVYYLAGSYDPISGHITMEPGVS